MFIQSKHVSLLINQKTNVTHHSMAISRFYEKIKNSTVEREVEAVYNEGLNRYFKNVPISHPYACDGYMETKTEANHILRLLIEYKYDENFLSSAGKAKVLIQVVFYLKQFELNGQPLPNVILVGDINECFVLQSNCLLPYLDETVDWNVAPSEAYQRYPELMLKISNDAQINPFVFSVDENFSFLNVANRIIDQSDNVQRLVRVTEHNIANIYDYFQSRVIKNANKIPANELVATFVGVITDQDNYYIHPKNPNKLVAGSAQFDVDSKSYHAFFSVVNKKYTPEEQHKFTEISDRLIEETNRRRKGEFYTPTAFVDYAHKMIGEQLGEDWREKYVVWDCCWGTGNLTRDYYFKELYASTLEQGELSIGEKYNQGSVKFIFDFLNSPIEDIFGAHIPTGLLDALKNNRPILFFINPPYARAGKSDDGIGSMGTSKGTAETKINKTMKKDNIGACSANLYGQFLYRILLIKTHYNLTNIAIGLFCPPLFLTGETWAKFRQKYLSNFQYQEGVLFQASHFADVAANWGIMFTIWKHGESIDKSNFNANLIDLADGEIKTIGQKGIYNTDAYTKASEWVSVRISKDKEIPTLKSALNIGNKTLMTADNVLGWFTNGNNNVNHSSMDVYLMACPNNIGKTNVPIINDNFIKCLTVFSARKLIDASWINSKDEYLAPDIESEKWNEFANDSVIYSLFHSSSNQSSLRGLEYNGNQWNIIKNEFFFMSKDEIKQLAEENNLIATYEEARTDIERYVYKYIQNLQLSAEAQAVLDKAIELTRKSFKFRSLFDQEHPEYQILNWDCGWYQIKGMLNAYLPNELKEFSILFKALADKMRPMVYELGFLK